MPKRSENKILLGTENQTFVFLVTTRYPETFSLFIGQNTGPFVIKHLYLTRNKNQDFQTDINLDCL